jgi:hypothetical protein
MTTVDDNFIDDYYYMEFSITIDNKFRYRIIFLYIYPMVKDDGELKSDKLKWTSKNCEIL